MNGAYENRIKLMGSLTRCLPPIAVITAYLDNEIFFGKHSRSYPKRWSDAVDCLQAEVSAIQQESTNQRGG